MLPSIAILFFIIFAGVLTAVVVGLKYYESRRKKQVTAILKTISGEAVRVETKILKDAPGDQGKGFNRLLACFNLAEKSEAYIRQAGLEWSLKRLLAMMAAGAVTASLAGGLLLTSLPAALSATLGGCLGAALPYLYVLRKRNRRMACFEEQLPDALDFLARSMRAGHAFSISLQMMSEEMPDPVGIEFRTLFNEQNLGAPLEIALRNLTDRVPLIDVRFFASAVMMQRQTGGNLAEILTRLAYVIRERFRLKGQVKAASAHGRMTAGILAAMPICTMFGLLVVAPGYLEGMAADKDGRHLIVGCVIAQVIGNLCIRKIIKIKI